MIKLYKTTIHKLFICLVLSSIFMSSQAGNVITIKVGENGNVFTPQNVIANIGDSIKWVWVGGVHSITAISVPDQSLSWNQPLSANAPVFSCKVIVPGTYTYKSIFQNGATGSVVVSSPLTNTAALQHSKVIDIFPNPFTRSLVIDFRNYDFSSKPLVEIYDLVGKLRVHTKFVDQFKDGKLYIETEDLDPGVYFIYVIDDGKKDIYKIIKSAENR